MCTASPNPCSDGSVDVSNSVPCLCLYTGRTRQDKECDNAAKYCESPRQSKWCYSGADSITPSVHQGNATAQHRGSGTQHHLHIVGTEITSFQVEKLITLRRWWYAWKSFLHTSNRWTTCAVSVCSHCKIVAKSRRVVPIALLPPWPVNPVGNAKGAFTCSFSWRVLTKGL